MRASMRAHTGNKPQAKQDHSDVKAPRPHDNTHVHRHAVKFERLQTRHQRRGTATQRWSPSVIPFQNTVL